jgi:hypothetical protein
MERGYRRKVGSALVAKKKSKNIHSSKASALLDFICGTPHL